MTALGTTRMVDLADGARLAVTTEGTGPDLLLVSGLGGTGGFWLPTVPGLASRFRVTWFDQRGLGGSSRGTAPCTIDQLAQDCIAVADALGMERPVFCGHSTGGAIGQALGRMAPERLGALVLSATWLKPNRYMDALFATRRRILDLDPAAYASLGALLGYAPAWLESNWAAFEATKPPASEEAREVVRERIAALLAFDGSTGVASLALPTLVMGARDDAIVPAFLQEELARALPGPRTVMYEDGGHFFPVTRTADFVRDIGLFADGL